MPNGQKNLNVGVAQNRTARVNAYVNLQKDLYDYTAEKNTISECKVFYVSIFNFMRPFSILCSDD